MGRGLEDAQGIIFDGSRSLGFCGDTREMGPQTFAVFFHKYCYWQRVVNVAPHGQTKKKAVHGQFVGDRISCSA